jgi:uncharacterized protein YbaP (TraB family)
MLREWVSRKDESVKMKKLFISVIGFCAFLIALMYFIPGNTGKSPEIKSAEGRIVNISQSSSSNTFLWKVEKAGAPTSYLLGTLHLGRYGETLSPQVLNAFHQTQVLATETNVMPEGSELIEISMMMMDMEGSLTRKLGQARFNQLAKAVSDMVPASGLDKMKPWAALTLVAYNKPEGYSELFGIDMLLTQKAVEAGKKRVFLEPMLESLNAFASLPEDKAISAINITLDHADEARRETAAMINLYQTNQADALVAMMSDKELLLKYYPAQDRAFWDSWMNQTLLANRNDRWMSVINRQLSSEPTLVAVGAMHLFGTDGLIKLLQAQGYTVTPVMAN